MEQPRRRGYQALATVQTALTAQRRVDALCLKCEHMRRLDLAHLAGRGHENTPLTRLPLRCTACQASDFRVIVSGQVYR
jgi:hypothetical protein